MFSGILIGFVALVSWSEGELLPRPLINQNPNSYLVLMTSGRSNLTNINRLKAQVFKNACLDHQIIRPIQKNLMMNCGKTGLLANDFCAARCVFGILGVHCGGHHDQHEN